MFTGVYNACMCVYADGREVDVQYSNWKNSYPYDASSDSCVVVTVTNKWLPYICNKQKKYVCQSE